MDWLRTEGTNLSIVMCAFNVNSGVDHTGRHCFLQQVFLCYTHSRQTLNSFQPDWSIVIHGIWRTEHFWHVLVLLMFCCTCFGRCKQTFFSTEMFSESFCVTDVSLCFIYHYLNFLQRENLIVRCFILAWVYM